MDDVEIITILRIVWKRLWLIVLGTALFATFMLVVRGVCGSAPPILDE